MVKSLVARFHLFSTLCVALFVLLANPCVFEQLCVSSAEALLAIESPHHLTHHQGASVPHSHEGEHEANELPSHKVPTSDVPAQHEHGATEVIGLLAAQKSSSEQSVSEGIAPGTFVATSYPSVIWYLHELHAALVHQYEKQLLGYPPQFVGGLVRLMFSLNAPQGPPSPF